MKNLLSDIELGSNRSHSGLAVGYRLKILGGGQQNLSAARPTLFTASANIGIHLRIHVTRTSAMTIPKVNICCSKCHVVICSSSNEWRRLEDVSLITPVQKTWFQTITIAKAQGFLPLEPVPADLHNDIVFEATCAKCGSVLGQGFGDVVHEDPMVNRCVAYDALLLACLTSQ